MNKFNSIFILESKRLLRLTNIIIFFVISVILILIVQHGKNRYVKSLDNIDAFQNTEDTKVSQYVLYRQYGAFGIRLLFIPSPFSVLYNDYVFDVLLSRVNISEELNIYKPIKGKSFFISRAGFMNFAGIILFLGCFLALFFGSNTTNEKEFSKYQASINRNSIKVFWPLVLSRITIFNLAFLVLILIPLFILQISNINLLCTPLVYILLVSVLLNIFLFGVGCIIGFLNRSIKWVVFGIVYFAFVFFIPFLADTSQEIATGGIESVFKFDLINLKTIMEADRKLIDKFGSRKSNEDVPPEIVEEVMTASENVHGKVDNRESRRKNEMLEDIKQHQKRLSYFPVLFYLSVIKEVSGQGGFTFIEFYSFGQQRKQEFINFYLDKRFKGKNKPDQIGTVENFVKSDENLFYAKSRLPYFFWGGVLISFLYIFGVYYISYLMFKKQLIGDPGDLRGLIIDIKPGRLNLLLTGDEGLKNQVFNFLRGKGKSFVKIFIDGEEIEPGDIRFVHLFDTEKLPGDITARALYKFLFGKKMKTPMEKSDVHFSWASKSAGNDTIILMDQFLDRFNQDKIKKVKRDIHSKGLNVLYITDKFHFGVFLTDETIIYHENDKTVDKPGNPSYKPTYH